MSWAKPMTWEPERKAERIRIYGRFEVRREIVANTCTLDTQEMVDPSQEKWDSPRQGKEYSGHFYVLKTSGIASSSQ